MAYGHFSVILHPCAERNLAVSGLQGKWGPLPEALCCPPPATHDGQSLLFSSGQGQYKMDYCNLLSGDKGNLHTAEAAHCSVTQGHDNDLSL